MGRLFSYLRGYGARISLGLFIKTCGTFMDLCIPWALSHIIDEVIPKNDIAAVYFWGGIMLIFCLIAWGGNIIANRMAASISRDATRRLRHSLFTKISYLSSSDVDKFTVPSLIHRMTADTYTIHHTLGMIQRIGIRAPILLFGGVIITFMSDPALTLILILLIPVVSFMTYAVSKKSAALFRKVQSASDAVIRTVRENASGARVIKALSKSDYEKKRFFEVNSDLTAKEKQAQYTTAFTSPAMTIILNLGLCAVILVGAYRVNSGKSEIGDIIAFMTYFTIILNSIMMITRIFMNLSRASASAARIDEVLETPDDLAIGGEVTENASAPALEFRNVSFRYESTGFSLSDISFSLKKGQTLGIFGATGSGKTSVISLLLRFYLPDSGEIFINGVDTRNYTLSALRRKFGTVLQNDTLFHDTIEENISFGRDISPEDMDSAVRTAQADSFIAEAGGFSAEVAIKGGNFSGGQKQRLLISRALAGQSEILIFDDSFSALDYKTDSKLRECLRSDFSDRTKVIVAQRVSSIMFADHILVLDGGKCIGYGTHEELLLTCPAYAETAELQLGGELVEEK